MGISEKILLTRNFIMANKLRSLLVFLGVACFLTLLGFLISRLEGINIETIERWVRTYGYIVIFALVMVGNIGVPVPEETTVLASGYAAQQGWLDYKIVVLVCLFSAIVGDNIGYMIGRKGGRTLILRYGRYIGVDEKRLRKFEGFFERHGDKTVFVARFIAGLRFMAGPLSGAAHMPFGRFFFFNAFGAVVWVLVITQIGYHFGSQFHRIIPLLGKAKLTIGIAIAIGVAIWFYLRKRRRAQAAE